MEKLSETIWPLLDHPLILVGFIVFLALSTYRALLAAGVIPPISQKAGGAAVQSFLRYVFYLAIVGMVLGFGIRYFELYLDRDIGQKPETLGFSEIQVGENGSDRGFLISKLGVPEQANSDPSGFDLFGVGDRLILVDYFNNEIVGKAVLGDLSTTKISRRYGLYEFDKVARLSDMLDDAPYCSISLRVPNEFTGGSAGQESEFVVVGCGGFTNSEGFRDWGVYTDAYAFWSALNNGLGNDHPLEKRLEEAKCVTVNWSDPDIVNCEDVYATSAGGIALDGDETEALYSVAKSIPVWGFFDCSFFGNGVSSEINVRSGCYELEEIVLGELAYITTRLKL